MDWKGGDWSEGGKGSNESVHTCQGVYTAANLWRFTVCIQEHNKMIMLVLQFISMHVSIPLE